MELSVTYCSLSRGDGSAKRRVRLSKYVALSMKTNDLSQIKLEKRDFFREQSHYVP